MESISERLLRLRKDRKLTQQEFSKLAKVARATVAQWEAGTKIPGRSSLEHLSDIFGVSLDWLTGKTEDMYALTAGDEQFMKDLHLPLEQLIEKYDFGVDLSADEIKEIVEMIKVKNYMKNKKEG